MSNQQLVIGRNQILLLIGASILVTLGAAAFFFISSNKKTTPISYDKKIDNSGTDTTSSEGFLGEKGEMIESRDDKVYIGESKVKDGNLHAFNHYSEKEKKTIYFFIVKASDGTYRAAANACEVCFGTKKGFRQIGDKIRCENCQTLYSKDQIAMQKGGCNPRPIEKDVKVTDGKLVIDVSVIEKIADLF